MSAAARAQAPLSQEALTFWHDLSRECQRYAAVVNTVVFAKGLTADDFISCSLDNELLITKATAPSTTVKIAIDLFSWGPVIRGRATGVGMNQIEFYREEWEAPIAKDLDGSVVAIFGEGRSFSAAELARYLIQNFRRCYPGIALPCEFPPFRSRS